MLVWKLTDLECNVIGVIGERKVGSNVVMPLCDTRRAQVTVSLDDDIVHEAAALKTGLYAEYFGVPVFHGPVVQPVFKGSSGGLISAVDGGSEWLARSFLQSPVESTGDLFAIAAALVDQRPFDEIRGYGNFDLKRVVLGVIEASGVPDVTMTWNAGDSFYKVLTDVFELLDGPEFDLEPLRPGITHSMSGGSIPRKVWTRLNLLKRIGTDRSDTLKFEYGFGQNNCSDFEIAPQGSSVKNFFVQKGQTGADQVQPSAYSDNAQSRRELGTWEGYASSQYDSNEACKSAAQQQVAAYAFPPQGVGVSPAMEGTRDQDEKTYGIPPKFMHEYFLGDNVAASGQLGSRRYTGDGRVTQATLTEVDGHGNTQVELTCVPVVTSAGVS